MTDQDSRNSDQKNKVEKENIEKRVKGGEICGDGRKCDFGWERKLKSHIGQSPKNVVNGGVPVVHSAL